MCGVCGCGESEARVEHIHGENRPQGHSGQAPDAHGHQWGEQHACELTPARIHSRQHALVRERAGNSAPNTYGSDAPVHHHGVNDLRDDPAERAHLVSVEQDILAKNDALAAHNRRHFEQHRVLALNLLSSPGAGKTTLLVKTLQRLLPEATVAVIEGDQETSADADRIRATGAPAIQVNTGKGCHLDAAMIDRAFSQLHFHDGTLFIENVGNLVCPAGFDLGEAHKIVIASVTEGEDKPLKYPNMFAAASLMLVSKVDLLPHLAFDVEALISNARRVNPGIGVIQVAATSGEGMDRWLRWISAAGLMASASA